MNILNGKGESKRYVLTLIGFVGIILCAVLKNWLKGLDVGLVITAAGLITAYNAAESYRPSGTQGPPNRGMPNGQAIPTDQAGVTMKMECQSGTKP